MKYVVWFLRVGTFLDLSHQRITQWGLWNDVEVSKKLEKNIEETVNTIRKDNNNFIDIV